MRLKFLREVTLSCLTAIVINNNAFAAENMPVFIKNQLALNISQSLMMNNLNIFKDLGGGSIFLYQFPSNISDQSVDPTLISWIKSNISPKTGLFLSFGILKDDKNDVYSTMGEAASVSGIIERVIVENGLVIYDGAVGQIALTIAGGVDELRLAQKPIEVYWKGSLGALTSIRSGYPNNFFYDPLIPDSVVSNLEQKGKRGFIFRIINANGDYLSKDPLDGKEYFEGFPSWPEIHWEDWKPVAGENAWVAMAAMQVFHKKFFNNGINNYDQHEDSVELCLAEELARAAIILQTETGGIRMAPLGTFRENETGSQADRGSWWYHQISTENTLSWYGAFRMLYRVTGKAEYLLAMKRMDKYFQLVFNKKDKYFFQGMSFINGSWQVNASDFAVDVQTWGVLALGVETIDSWFGVGAAYGSWQRIKALSSTYNVNNALAGVGYTTETGRISVEWTAGAIMAVRQMAQYYERSHPHWAQELLREADEMRAGMELLRRDLPGGASAYAYSSKRGSIPFGWNSHDPRVLSLASTGWMIFVDQQYNPFFIDGNEQGTDLKVIVQNTVQVDIGSDG